MPDEVQIGEPGGELISPSQDAPVPCERLIGCAGTGKTYTLLKRTTEDPKYGILTSTTGISAVNLGAITINSTLHYSTLDVLKDIWMSGRLAITLHKIAKQHRRLIVEEYSMADADSLDIWYHGVQEANRYKDIEEPLGILLVGDLAQLPPVKGRWCFEADCWSRFADNTTKLTKVWRQDTGLFLDALNFLRAGDGRAAMETLTQAGAKWETCVDMEFNGTTILPKNDMVNRFNKFGLDRVRGKSFTVASRRWGKQLSEWGLNPRTHEWGVPLELELKIGAYVMVLANSSDFSVVNGDCGTVVDYDGKTKTAAVDMKRTKTVAYIPPLVRSVDVDDEPLGFTGLNTDGGYWEQIHFDERRRRFVVGQIERLPLRLAYATTVHKSQSLTLDKVQCDFRDRFFSLPAMLYVALSRCRTMEGLRLVGTPDRFVKQCAVDSRVLPWI